MLGDEQRLIRDLARDFANKYIAEKSDSWRESKTFPTDAIKEMAKLGFCGMLVPEQFHGSNIGHIAYVLVLEEIAAADASCSTILSVHNSVACLPILKFGNDKQKEKYLKPMASGELLGAFCLTEAEAGSDAANLGTTATKTNSGYILNGSKQFITSGKSADIAIVFATLDKKLGKKGICAFIVPTNSKGYNINRVEDKMGQEAAETVQISFDNLEIPAENLLGQEGEGYKIALANLEGGRIGIAAQCLGMAKAALDQSINYAKERITFKKPIIEHQGISFMLAQMATSLEAARQLTLHAAKLRDENLPCIKESSMAKLFASETAISICDRAIQIYGGYGYLKDFKVEQIYRDVRVTTLYEGTSEIQKIVIAKELAKTKLRNSL